MREGRAAPRAAAGVWGVDSPRRRCWGSGWVGRREYLAFRSHGSAPAGSPRSSRRWRGKQASPRPEPADSARLARRWGAAFRFSCWWEALRRSLPPLSASRRSPRRSHPARRPGVPCAHAPRRLPLDRVRRLRAAVLAPRMGRHGHGGRPGDDPMGRGRAWRAGGQPGPGPAFRRALGRCAEVMAADRADAGDSGADEAGPRFAQEGLKAAPRLG
jgi:hypothetical protein